jgi:hypothetical protein
VEEVAQAAQQAVPARRVSYYGRAIAVVLGVLELVEVGLVELGLLDPDILAAGRCDVGGSQPASSGLTTN